MSQKKAMSLRLFALLLVGATFAAFAIILFSIFQATMPKMLLRSESRYLQQQLELVGGLFDKDLQRALMMADDLAIWDQTTLFAQGENPDYVERNWPDNPPLKNYHFNFIYIKDIHNRDLYADSLDYDSGKKLNIPEGFSEYLNTFSSRVLERYSGDSPPEADSASMGMSGIIFYRGTSYSLAIMPIMPARELGRPAGTVILGTVLTNDYFRQLTHYPTSTFALEPLENSAPEMESAINRESRDLVSTTTPYRDLEGRPLVLRMSDSRVIYQEGKTLLDSASLLFLAVFVVFAFVLYRVLASLMLTPIARLSKDIAGLDGTLLEPEKYSKSREFVRLCTAINEMLGKLNQSKVSIESLHQMLDGIDSLVYVTDPETDEILFVNNRLAEHFQAEGGLVGRKCWQVFHPGMTGHCPHCPLDELQKDKSKLVVREEYSPITGRYYKKAGSLITWGGGKKLAHLQHVMDITPAKTAEASLKKRLEQQELMSAMSQSFISTLDTPSLINNGLEMAGSFLDVSKILVVRHNQEAQTLDAAYEWYNPNHDCYQPEATSAPFVPGTPEYAAFITERASVLVLDDIRGVPGFEYAESHGLLSLADVPLFVGGAFWGILSFGECAKERSWSESDIHLTKLIGSVISGVLMRQHTENELKRMSSIVDSSPQFISYVDLEGNFKYVNPGAIKALGYSREELTNLKILYDDETHAKVISEIFPAILKDGSRSFELPVRCKDGSIKAMSFSAFKTDFQSEELGIGAIALDITEKLQLEKDLVAAKDLAEQSSRAKSEFLSRMSHEMRTPLNAIIGMTNIAKASSDPGKKEYCLDKIDNASAHLLGVINDILDMSKIAANKFELSPTEFDLEKTLMTVINVVNFRVDEKGQTLIVNIDHAIPQRIVADEQRLAQVMVNLLSNAVKFTPEGGTITLSVRMLSREGTSCELQIDVTDTGIGVTPEQMGRLFKSFEQADGGIARKFGGTGLGLAISKNIIELMGGRIWVESEPGGGSTFTFTIQAQLGAAAPAPSRLNPDIRWKDLHVLVVDDAPEVLEYFLNFAQAVGLRCEAASGGAEALELIEKSASDPFNMIFVDWKMPDLDGIELTKRIKKDRAEETVVIMISAARWSDVEEEAKAAGVDRFIPKPLFSSLIVDTINQCLGLKGRARPEGPETSQENGCFNGRRVLLAEDIDINREIVLSMLEHTGLTIDSAENGQAACEMFARNPAAYDLVLMDIHMPEVDGYEATRRIRAMSAPEAATVPIVAMTANVFREDVEKCLAAGMNDHISKPVNTAELMEKLRRYLPAAASC